MTFIYNGLAVVLLLIISSCHTVKPEEVPDAGFCLSDTLKQKVTITEVRSAKVKNVIELTGQISADEDKWVKIFPVVSGTVQKLNVQLGDYVKKGEVLAIIQSSEIADYQHQSATARSSMEVAEKTMAATEEMYKAGLVTEKELIAAKNDLNNARSELKRIDQIVSIYGAKNNAVQTITAPVSGFVIEKNITEKMQYRTDSDHPFFIISNLDEIWVMGSVFESDIAKIKEGYDAEIRVLAFDGKVYKGKVDRMFSVLDPESRVMKVRIRIANEGYLLKPGMFARINVTYDYGGDQLPSIPSDAVIFDNNKNYTIVYQDDCNMEVREVEIFRTIDDVSYIKSGLKDGEKVLSGYQLLVFNALKAE